MLEPQDEECGVSTITDPTMNSDVSTNAQHQQFLSAILLTRQLCAEDARLTGFSYAQWWSEQFGRSNSTTGSDKGNWLRSRASLMLLANLLIDLLPYETDPRLLTVQLATNPLMGRKKSRAPVIGQTSGTKEGVEDKDSLDDVSSSFLPDGDEASMLAALTSMDAALAEACLQRWNDYKEIGRARIAELRDRGDTGPTAFLSIHPVKQATPGWDEVSQWLVETAHQMTMGAGVQTIRLPHGLTEANLFRPRQFRDTFIPALLNASEITDLSSDMASARLELLRSMEAAGFAELLIPTSQTARGMRQKNENKVPFNRKRRNPIGKNTGAKRGRAAKKMI